MRGKAERARMMQPGEGKAFVLIYICVERERGKFHTLIAAYKYLNV